LSARRPWIEYEYDGSKGTWVYKASFPNGSGDANSWPTTKSKGSEDLEAFLTRVNQGPEEADQLNLFENWRSFLSEKKWEDYGAPKNSWKKIPTEDIKVSESGEVTIADELYKLIDTAYAGIGGHFDFQTPGDLPADYTDWIASDIDADPGPDVLRVSKKKGSGYKMSAAGHDGTRKAIDAYVAKTAELLKSKGYFGEMSKGIAHVMITRHQVPFVGNKEDVEQVLGKEIRWIGEHPKGKYPGYDGWYERAIGGEHVDMKIMLGQPEGLSGHEEESVEDETPI